MKNRVVLFFLIFFVVTRLFSQEKIAADIVNLSELAYYKNPVIERNALTVDNAEGELQIQKSTFDYLLTSGVSVGRNSLHLFSQDPRNEFIDGVFNSRSATASLGLSKTFRTSLIANLSVDYTKTGDNLPLNSFNQNVDPYIDDHLVSGTFSLTQPLLRGRGRSIAITFEEVASLNLESANKNFVFANSFELLQTGLSYWDYLSAYRSLKIYEENEARVKRVLDITQKLVDADKKPKGDLSQIKADLANQERQTSLAKQLLYTARLNLGRAIGLSEENSKRIGDPVSEFPNISETGYGKELNLADLQEIAQNHREDIKAAGKAEQAAILQLKSADNNLRPILDLSGFVNYGGMSMGNGLGRAISAFSQEEGRDLGFGLRLNFSFPLNNNSAKGAYVQNKALLQDQKVVNENLKRNIDINVSLALNNLDNSVSVLRKAGESLNYYQEVYDNEKIKFRNGLTTLLNLIIFQERLTVAQLEYLEAHRQFASAIINLRYETGTLLESQDMTDNKLIKIRKQLFYTIPVQN